MTFLIKRIRPMKIQQVANNPDLIVIDGRWRISLSTGEITDFDGTKAYDPPEYNFKFRDEALAGK